MKRQSTQLQNKRAGSAQLLLNCSPIFQEHLTKNRTTNIFLLLSKREKNKINSKHSESLTPQTQVNMRGRHRSSRTELP